MAATTAVAYGAYNKLQQLLLVVTIAAQKPDYVRSYVVENSDVIGNLFRFQAYHYRQRHQRALT